MRAIILTSFLALTSALYVQGQLLQADSTWTKETFDFPINFAPGINLQGREEAVFPKNWGKKDSPEFWTYTFVWEVKQEQAMTADELEENLKIYFDGLMKSVNKHPELELPFTTASLMHQKQVDKHTQYAGAATVFDAFFTRKPTTLYTLIDVYPCTGKVIYQFRFSPQALGSSAWQLLDQVKLNTGGC